MAQLQMIDINHAEYEGEKERHRNDNHRKNMQCAGMLVNT